ncbi:MAG TPA: GFA family protein [Frateuria sp.]|uniref:GFA family protein n=1 Tax=Frateuria sp. TaxID=2211372 RepID=UPI002D801B0F|nr:GFA family protein [Frateuria sp.]HET6806529.1 GFA family protein [Frateuria sp.]
MKKLKGSCLCRQVSFEVADEFIFLGYCHCSECRKWTGSAFATGGMVPASALTLTAGSEVVRHYRKSVQTELVFCGQCGSSLYSRKLLVDRCIVRLGTLDDTPTRAPNVHIYCASKAPWYEIMDALPQYDELPE